MPSSTVLQGTDPLIVSALVHLVGALLTKASLKQASPEQIPGRSSLRA